MPALALLADDLTGALDAAAPFAGRGWRVEVALSPDAVAAALATDPDLVAVSTDSRERPADEARAALARALAALPPGTALFKKVDSRLKGPIAAELAALPPRPLLVAPAIPGFGRVVRGGAVAGFGVAEPIPVAPRLGAAAARAIIPDAATDADLDAALAAAPPDALPVGARGLAEALARRLTGRREAVPAALPRGPAVLAVGSRDPITRAQVDALRGRPGVRVVAAPNGAFDPRALDGAALAVVEAVPGPAPCAPEAVAAALAAGLRGVAGGVLLLSGGATAAAVLAGLGIARLRLLGEVLPGLPVGVAGPLTVVAKSGGFGGPDTLARIADLVAPVPA